MGKKYIDADALKDYIEIWSIGDRRDKKWLLNAVNSEPPADVRPNVKGEWKSISYGKCPCSVCGSEALYKVDWYESGQGTSSNIEKCRSNFCPNCGADMRGH